MKQLVKLVVGSVLLVAGPVMAEEHLAISADERNTFAGTYLHDETRIDFQSIQIPQQTIELKIRLNGAERVANYDLQAQKLEFISGADLNPAQQAALYDAAEAARAYAKTSNSATPAHMAVLIGAMNYWGN